MMKKVVALLLMLLFAGSLAYAQNIGYIEVQKVFRAYKATSKAQEELGKQEESFKKDFEDSQKKLEKAEKEGKKREELDKMRKDFEEKLNPKRDSLLKLNEQLTTKLQLEIVDAVKAVAKKVGTDMVLDKQVIIIGGTDLTEMVINELNK